MLPKIYSLELKISIIIFISTNNVKFSYYQSKDWITLLHKMNHCVTDLDTNKKVFESQNSIFHQFFSQLPGRPQLINQLGPNHVCVILSRRRDTITSVWYYVSHRRDVRDVLSLELCLFIHFFNNVWFLDLFLP